LQGFLSAFPQYNPGQRPNQTNVEPTGINLFAESYGGQYGPVFADFFEDQNERRQAGLLPANSTLEIKLDSLGIINGLVDTTIQTPSLASFVYSNTYDLQGMSLTQYLNLLSDFKKPDGCLERASKCHARATAGNDEGENLGEETMDMCASASSSCWGIQSEALLLSGRSPYDIRVTSPSSVPSYAYLEYLNQANVLRSIGAKVNFTDSTSMVNVAFHQGKYLLKRLSIDTKPCQLVTTYAERKSRNLLTYLLVMSEWL
jgi:carboxypeptidase C (cathepsin A)